MSIIKVLEQMSDYNVLLSFIFLMLQKVVNI